MIGRIASGFLGATLCAMAAAATAPAVAAPKQVVADLSNSSVDITSSYHGTELLLFGAYEGRPGDDIVLIVQGPPTDIIQRRKVPSVYLRRTLQFHRSSRRESQSAPYPVML